MRIEITESAAEYVRARGGRLWVWAAYPALRCDGMQARVHAVTQLPRNATGFSACHAGGVQILFRRFGGREPQVLQIGMHGRIRPRAEAYWDGCLFAT
jgi:hypothetical protein